MGPYIADWEEAIEGLRSLLFGWGLLEEGHEALLLIDQELEIQEDLLESGYHKTVLIRQSTFFESFLSSSLQIVIEDKLEHDMYNEDVKYLQREVSPTGKVRLAYWLEILEKDERDALLELMSVRGTIAHSAWVELEYDEQAEDAQYDYDRIAERIYELLEETGEELEF